MRKRDEKMVCLGETKHVWCLVLVAEEVVKVVVEEGSQGASLGLVADGDLEDVAERLVEDSLGHVALEETVGGKRECLLGNLLIGLVEALDDEATADGDAEGALNGGEDAAKVDGLGSEGGARLGHDVVAAVKNGRDNLGSDDIGATSRVDANDNLAVQATVNNSPSVIREALVGADGVQVDGRGDLDVIVLYGKGG